MNKDQIFTWIAAFFYLAILYILVRPGSAGPNIVTNVLGAFADLVRGTVGYTYDPNSNQWSPP